MHSIPQPLRHLRKPLRLNKMIEGKSREHGAVTMHIRLHHERRPAHAVEINDAFRARVPCVRLVGHEAAVSRELRVALEEDLV